MIRFTVHFYGRVQGVGFRYTTRNVGSLFAVAGYVQNDEDGSVLLEAEGTPEELQRFVAAVLETMRRNIHHHTLSRSPATGEFGPPVHGAIRIRQ
jgi:acylphosphatase